jgi:hypothetical protein
LLLIVAALTVIAGLAEPATYDALTYHLPRAAHWLQLGRIGIIGASDARLDFVAGLPEIVTAWLLGATREGYRLVLLVQAIGGIMTVAGTVGLARRSGLTRPASILAGALLMGMANVVGQFTAAQTDLFTTGLFVGAFYLWWVALERKETSAPGIIGAGLALGAKGTIFYLAPGAALWVGWLAWYHRLWGAQLLRTLLLGICGVTLFALPGFVRNWRAYGDPLGPEVWVKKHHQGFDSVHGQLKKLSLNLTTSLAQNFDPQSQPLPLRNLSRGVGQFLLRQLPNTDEYTLAGVQRTKKLAGILERTIPDTDAVSFGVASLTLFLLGLCLAVSRRGQKQATLVIVWGGGVIAFLLFFHALQQWHPFAFRYFVLAAPWIAVVSAWGIEQLTGNWKLCVWATAVACSLNICWWVTTQANQSGWPMVVRPQISLGLFAASGWKEWSTHLDHPDEPFTIMLPEERPLTAFYRQWPPRTIQYEAFTLGSETTAEGLAAAHRGWTILPAKTLLGREGRVAASVVLFDGDEASPFSLAAYRRLEPGEEPQPVIYRNRRIRGDMTLGHDVIVRSGTREKFRVLVKNSSKANRTYEMFTPVERTGGVVPAGSNLIVELKVVPNAINRIIVGFQAIDAKIPAADLPVVVLNPIP